VFDWNCSKVFVVARFLGASSAQVGSCEQTWLRKRSVSPAQTCDTDWPADLAWLFGGKNKRNLSERTDAVEILRL